LGGIVVSVCGLYLKWACEELDFHGPATPKNPIKQAFQLGWTLAASFLILMLWTARFYLMFVWLAIYMNDLVSPPVPQAFWVNSASLFCSVCLFFPLAGGLSDQYGRIHIMTIGAIAFGVLSPFLIYATIGLGNPYIAFLLQSILGICLSAWGAPMMAWRVEAFPPDACLTSVVIGYNVAQAIMGGATPVIATLLADKWTPSPGFLLMGIAICSLVGLHCMAPPGKEQLPQ
jgi:MHS family proline/betaine transporter-like MFS transporter